LDTFKAIHEFGSHMTRRYFASLPTASLASLNTM
jgi:hypothetical protein